MTQLSYNNCGDGGINVPEVKTQAGEQSTKMFQMPEVLWLPRGV
jgi:hypothetical protein